MMAKQPKWAEEELQYLADRYGVVSDEVIMKKLGRSRRAIIIAARRKLGGLRRKDNFYTARELAKILGICDAKTIVWWRSKGWITGKRNSMRAGLSQVWHFSEGQVVRCLRRRPWLVDLQKMDEHYFRSVVKKEWERDPWFTSDEVASLLGIKSGDTIRRYIHRGWLSAEKKPGGPHQGHWIFKKSAIDQFLSNDPRPDHERRAYSEARRKSILEAGRPSRIAVVWVIICPSCKEKVALTAPPHLKGPRVREVFLDLYVNGHCTHGAAANLSMNEREVKPENDTYKQGERE